MEIDFKRLEVPKKSILSPIGPIKYKRVIGMQNRRFLNICYTGVTEKR